MHTYIGTKMILAKPMNLGEYNQYRGWPMPSNEDVDAPGYLVEYMDGKANHENHTGYISWSPKATFDESYLDLGMIEGRLPHQQRVIGEHAQLQKKCNDLGNFLGNPFFDKLDGAEQGRLRLQYRAMTQYLAILDQRIDAFTC